MTFPIYREGDEVRFSMQVHFVHENRNNLCIEPLLLYSQCASVRGMSAVMWYNTLSYTRYTGGKFN